MDNKTSKVENDTNSMTTEATSSSGIIKDGKLTDEYLRYGYNDSNGKVDCAYVLEYAQNIAENLGGMNQEIFRAIWYGIVKEGKGLYVPIEQKKKAIAKQVIRVKKLVMRGVAPAVLYDIIEANYEAVKTPADFNSLCMHFEAIYCYMGVPVFRPIVNTTKTNISENFVYYVPRAGGRDDAYLVHIHPEVFCGTNWRYQNIEYAVSGTNHVMVSKLEHYPDEITQEVDVTLADNGRLCITKDGKFISFAEPSAYR